MQEFLGFAVTVIIISISGVMSPGPLFTANIIHGLLIIALATATRCLSPPDISFG